MKTRVGIGYDIHPLVPERKLVLGGVEIPFDKGLDGWSDADVLTHAVIDALLGATALGDIGSNFPSGEPEYVGISSLTLMEWIKKRLAEEGWRVVNVDTTVIAERPRLRDFIHSMREKLSRTLEINTDQVSVKASTSNKVGSIGREEGIAALAIVLIEGDD